MLAACRHTVKHVLSDKKAHQNFCISYFTFPILPLSWPQILTFLKAPLFYFPENNPYIMKLKFISFVALLLVASGSVTAQSAQIKAGVNFANVSVTGDGDVNDAKQLASFHVGIIGDLPLGTGLVTLQPGILFTGKGSKTQTGNTSSSTYSKQTFNPKYIEVPATIVLKLPLGKEGRLFAGAGPYVGIGIGGKNKIEGRFVGVDYIGEKDIKFSNDDPATFNEDEGAGFNILRRFDYGLNGTAGIESKNIVLSVNYGYGLAKLQSGSHSSADDANKHRVLSLSVGFKL
jgi:hypothetical protein